MRVAWLIPCAGLVIAGCAAPPSPGAAATVRPTFRKPTEAEWNKFLSAETVFEQTFPIGDEDTEHWVEFDLPRLEGAGQPTGLSWSGAGNASELWGSTKSVREIAAFYKPYLKPSKMWDKDFHGDPEHDLVFHGFTKRGYQVRMRITTQRPPLEPYPRFVDVRPTDKTFCFIGVSHPEGHKKGIRNQIIRSTGADIGLPIYPNSLAFGNKLEPSGLYCIPGGRYSPALSLVTADSEAQVRDWYLQRVPSLKQSASDKYEYVGFNSVGRPCAISFLWSKQEQRTQISMRWEIPVRVQTMEEFDQQNPNADPDDGSRVFNATGNH